jgi:RNA polymerase sigma-70 factor (ECF subfamily)
MLWEMAPEDPVHQEQEVRADERLLVEAAQRDPSRFVDLYDRHVDRIFAYVARRVGNRADAEELTSEVFQKALAGIGRFEWRGAPFASWLYRIAANEIADRFHRSGREQSLPMDEKAGDAQAEDTERRVWLSRSIEDLPADQGRVVRLRFFEERSIREIAEELGRTAGAVKQLQYRALENLRARMGQSHA